MKTKKEIKKKMEWLDKFETKYPNLSHGAFHNGFREAIVWVLSDNKKGRKKK